MATTVVGVSVLGVLHIAGGYANEHFPLESKGSSYHRYRKGSGVLESQDGGLPVRAPAPPSEHAGELSAASFATWLERLRADHRADHRAIGAGRHSGQLNHPAFDLARMPWADAPEVRALADQAAGAPRQRQIALAQLRLRLLESGLYWTLPAGIGERDIARLRHIYAPLELRELGRAEGAQGQPVLLYLAIDADAWAPLEEARALHLKAWGELLRTVMEHYNARPLEERRREIETYDALRQAANEPGRDSSVPHAPLDEFRREHPVFQLLHPLARLDRERFVFELRY